MSSAENLERLFGLGGRNAVVTGGGGTLGGAIATAFARAGAGVVLWGRRRATLEPRAAAVAEACGDPARVSFVEVDLEQEAQVGRALERTLEARGHFEILVNACGGNRGRSALVDVDPGQVEEVLRLNLLAGCLLPTRAVSRHWIEAGVEGSIINLASMAAYVPLSGVWAYSASKAGVVNLTEGAARELAPHRIRVNAVAPGFFLADQNRALLVDAETGELTQRGRDVVAHTPFGRFGDPEELAGVCLLLASPSAGGFITGATIPVDGGFRVHGI